MHEAGGRACVFFAVRMRGIRSKWPSQAFYASLRHHVKPFKCSLHDFEGTNFAHTVQQLLPQPGAYLFTVAVMLPCTT